MPPEVLAVFGPTAAGKSAVVHAAARELDAEVVVADPFQRYRGLEIAADAPTPEERAEVSYHLVGDLGLDQASTAADFADHADRAVTDVAGRGSLPIVAGGTGLYLRSALHAVAFPEPPDPDVRARIEQEVTDSLEAAVERLRAAAPGAAAEIDTANPRRVARALEALEGVSGAGPDIWSAPARRPYLLVAVTRPREVLDRLIGQRVQRELDDGLVAEIEAAIDHPAGLSREAAQIIGVKEVEAVRAGTLGVDDLAERLASRTRRLARKQMTWLRRMEPDEELDLGDDDAGSAGKRLAEVWRARRVG